MHTRRRLIKNLFILTVAIPLAPALASGRPAKHIQWPRHHGKSYFMSK